MGSTNTLDEIDRQVLPALIQILKLNWIGLYVGNNDAGLESTTLGGAYLNGKETQFINLEAITVGGSAIYISALYTPVLARIGGILVNSMYEAST